ncbi:MAG TPA: ferritin family protein [Candidatus Polarisedimenticolaceae bacterium]|nr:ferritin family protein [Candidatus Polarisedimenticolaceae bacterium]
MRRRRYRDLKPQEVLALAISLEEEDARILREFARLLRANYPGAAASLDEMSVQEDTHRHRLIDMFRRKFGEEIPLVRRHDVRGFVRRDPVQALRIPSAESIRRQVALMELETARFYEKAAAHAKDAELRQLLGDLAAEERKHEDTSMTFDPDHQPASERAAEARTARQLFVLQVVQPGLAGLMDGSVSTLAPLFASAFATHNSWDAFRVGIAASVGAGISMGFAEALSDDGSLTGRGKPLLRGVVCGAMTFVGGVFHALPFLIEKFMVATAVASCVVAVELFVIAWIRNRYMDTPFLQAAFQVVVGGVLVFLSGILIGSS